MIIQRNTCLKDAKATMRLGAQMAPLITSPLMVYLCGDLGAGKTTFMQGLIQSLTKTVSVKSPTYTLVETYSLPHHQTLHHFDLYRLSDPEELFYIGIDEYCHTNSMCFVEWPEKGAGVIPLPDLTLWFLYQDGARLLQLTAHTPKAEAILVSLMLPHGECHP